MAADEISAKVNIEGGKEAVKDLQAVGKEAKKLDGTEVKVPVGADTKKARKDVDDLLKTVDKLHKDPATILLTSNAKQIANEMGDLLLDIEKLDSEDVTIDAKVDQVNKLQGDLDKIEAKVREINDIPVDVDTRKVTSGVAEIGKSADSSKSALANMVGNSAQDLGQLGGIAGSSGVAIGQMAEYMADAKLAGEGFGSVLSSFASVTLPIAALSIGISLATKAWENYQETQKKIAERNKATVAALEEQLGLTDKLTKGYADATDTFGIFLSTMDDDAIKKTNQALAGLGLTVEDLDAVAKGFTLDPIKEATDLLRDAGVPADLAPMIGKIVAQYDDWKDIDFKLAQQLSTNDEKRARAFTKQIKAAEELQDQQENLINDDVAKQFLAEAAASGQAERAIVVHAIAVNTAADGQVHWKSAMVAATPELQKQAAATDAHKKKLDEDKQATLDTAAAIEQWGKDTEAAMVGAIQDAEAYAKALVAAQVAIGDLASVFSQMGARQDALSAIFDLKDAPLKFGGEVRDIAIAIDGLSEAAKGVKVGDILAGNVKADKFLDAIDAVRPDIQQKITEAFSTDGAPAAIKMANSYIDQVTKELGGRLTRAQVAKLLGLDDIEATVNVAVDNASLANAQKELDILTGITGENTYTASIKLALASDQISPQAAQILINQALKDAGVTVPAALEVTGTPEAIAEAEQFSRQNPVAVSSKLDTPQNIAAMATTVQILLAKFGVTMPSVLGNPTGIGPVLSNTQKTLNQNPLFVTFKARTDKFLGGFLQDAGGTTGPGGGIVGERRPEIVNGRYLITQPTVVPPGTRVTSGARTARILRTRGARGLRQYDRGGTVAGGNTTINFNGVGAIGNRYDVMRVVKQATRDQQRLLGTRP